MKPPIIIKADVNSYLSDISPFKENGIPANSIICKGRTAIGITTLAEKSEEPMILAIPGKQIILNKLSITDYDEFKPIGNKFPIFGGKGMTIPQRLIALKSFLKSDTPNKKIYTTPDSFWYIIEAAKDLGILQKVYRDFFLFVDEYHAYANEAFRKNIIKPFDEFWKFKRKCFASATPFHYKDENFEQLDYYKIVFPEQTLGKIDLIQTDNVPATLNYILTNLYSVDGNIHIFYNLVKYLGEQLRMVMTEIPDFDCNIFCSEKKENLLALNELEHFFNPMPTKDNLKKCNTYTARYFEGLDLFDKNAIIILVTDIRSTSAKVGIGNKGVQAIGRIRNKPKQIIHITNCHDETERRTFDEVYRQATFDAKTSIKNYNDNYRQASEEGLSPKESYENEVLKYAVIDDDNIANLHTIKVAQVVCEDYYSEDFNNIHFTKKAWKDAYYDVEEKKVMLSALPNVKLRNRAQKIRYWCEKFEELDKGIYLNSEKEEERLRKLGADHEEINIAHRAYKYIGIEKLEEIAYDPKTIDKEFKKLDSAEQYNLVIKSVLAEIVIGRSYSKSELKEILQEIYNKHGYTKVDGKRATAKATDLEQIFKSIDEDLSSEKKHFVDIKNKYVSVIVLQ